MDFGVDQILIKQVVNTNLINRVGTIECNFRFNKDLRIWEWIEAVEQSDWETNYKIIGRWYPAKNLAATKDIYLDIKSIEDGVLTATYKYIDRVDIVQSVEFDWVGTASADNIYEFTSTEDSIVLKIPEQGKTDKIEFEGYIFKPYR